MGAQRRVILLADVNHRSVGDAEIAWRNHDGRPWRCAWPMARVRVRWCRSTRNRCLPCWSPLSRTLRTLAPTPVAERVWATSYAPIRRAHHSHTTPEPLGPWLALLIALLFGVERWLATARAEWPRGERVGPPQALRRRWRVRACARVLLFALPWSAVILPPCVRPAKLAWMALHQPGSPQRGSSAPGACTMCAGWPARSTRMQLR
jgi:hypothetical protein